MAELPRRLSLAGALTVGAALLLSACGGSAAASVNDPVDVTSAYMKAIESSPTAGSQYLESKSDEKLVPPTNASKYMAAHKGVKWSIETVNYPPVGGTNPEPTKKACLVGAPPPSQICVVTVKIAAETPFWYHFVVENRYQPWQIIAIDSVDKAPDNLLPSGNEAHKS